MPSLDDIYRKFGEAAEAAQLLETEFGTMLFFAQVVEHGIVKASPSGIDVEEDPERAGAILDRINRTTLGQLLRDLGYKKEPQGYLEDLLLAALKDRNRLSHSFYRQHNFRRNSEEGRSVMMNDLERIHESLLSAYKVIMKLSGVDLETVLIGLPTGHVPIR